MAWITKHIPFLKRVDFPFVRYLATSIFASSADLVGFSIFIAMLNDPGLAAACSYIIGFVISFTLAKIWVFKVVSSATLKRELILYSLLAMLNIGVSWVVVHWMVDLRVNELTAKLITMFVIGVYSFILVKRMFKRGR